MSNAEKKAYLRAMGILSWVSNARLISESAKMTELLQALQESSIASTPTCLNWDDLAKNVASCVACDLHKTRTQTVFGVGNKQAQLVFVGEAPGMNEDRRGEPFVGRAGQLLDSMLKSIGLNRQEIFIANVLKCRPPNNRDPRPEEVEQCTPFLEQQLMLLQPKLIVALGRIAAHYLLKTNAPLNQMRNQRHSFGKNNIPLLVTFHPAYLLRSPLEKRKAYDDLLQIRQFLQN